MAHSIMCKTLNNTAWCVVSIINDLIIINLTFYSIILSLFQNRQKPNSHIPCQRSYISNIRFLHRQHPSPVLFHVISIYTQHYGSASSQILHQRFPYHSKGLLAICAEYCCHFGGTAPV